jgi:heme exporter protein CcmD
MTGTIRDGWEFVIAAYAVTALVLAGYAGSVLLRFRREERFARRDAEREPNG